MLYYYYSTHLYGRKLIIEWSEEKDDVESLRKKVKKHFSESN